MPSNRERRTPQFLQVSYAAKEHLVNVDVCRDVDERLVTVGARGSPGRVIVPWNVMRDPRVFRFKLFSDRKDVMLALRLKRLLGQSQLCCQIV